jgi:biopolymer transport protein ExbB
MEKQTVARGGGLNFVEILERSSVVIYIAIVLLAVWGIFNALMVYRTLAKKRLTPKGAETLLGQVREQLGKGNVKGAVEACTHPSFWHSALAQMIAVALRARDKGIAKVKQVLVMDFHTEVISGMENRLASLATAARLGPLLGLLGTVVSMIAAFGRMGAGTRPDPSALAGSISIGLWTTAAGLLLATPFMLVANDVAARLRRLRDQTERYLADFIEILEAQEPPARTTRREPSVSRSVLPR